MAKDTPPEKKCKNPDCDNTFIQYKSTDAFCSLPCYLKVKPPKEKKTQNTIPRRSKKRAKEEVVYNQLVKIFLKDPKNSICPVTGKKATEVHHKKGRIGKLLLDVNFWLGVSREGHKWIEENPKQAKKLGYSLSRLEV